MLVQVLLSLCQLSSAISPCSLDVKKGEVNKNLPQFLLSAHKKLLWFDPASDSFQVVHEGHGAYYSVLPDPSSKEQFWVVSTYRDLQGTDNADSILKLQLKAGEKATVVSQQNLQSKNTHSATLAGKNKLLVVNTRDGSIDEYKFPSVKYVQSFELFHRRDHLNSIALADPEGNSFWVLRHGRQHNVKADMVKVANGQIVDKITDTGYGSHSIVYWKDSIVYMSARPASIWAVELSTRKHTMLWTHDVDPNCGENQPFFAKGLAIVNNVAYFGLSRFETKREGRMNINVVMFAVDLNTGEVVWQRPLPADCGLVNEITVPLLSETSAWKEVKTEL
jgi:outer membrane protein assembly factor BamB